MGRPITRVPAILLMEDAVHLLRRAPMATLVCHLVGTAPFALALLLFWNDVNNPHTSDAAVARESMVLALLLVWLNSWRAVFAGRLRRQLSASLDTPWTWRRVWNLLAGQAFLSATKLIVWPLALLTLLPLAWTVTFYRSATALADRGDLDPAQLFSRARQLAGIDRRQSWGVLPILTFLQLAFTLNLALALAFLPQLLRMLTGYETQFSRSGAYFIFTPLFLWATLAVSWMLFDPYTQAVYCLRTFQAESLSNGEDIRAGLRMLAGAALVLLLAPICSFAAVAPQQLEQSVREALRAPEYDWHVPVQAAPESKNVPWFIRVTDRIIDAIQAGFRAIGKAIDDFIDWLRHAFQITPGTPDGKAPAAGLHWGLYALIAFVVLLAAWIAWRRRWFRPARPKAQVAPGLAAIRLDADDLTADRLPEESWLELAAQCMAEGNLRFALRAYYLANLAWLGRRQFLTIHAGKTNREYELELRRKARGVVEVRDLFAANIHEFERAWYGQHEVFADTIAAFRERQEGMKSLLEPAQGVAA